LELLSADFIFRWKNLHEPKQNKPVVPRETKHVPAKPCEAKQVGQNMMVMGQVQFFLNPFLGKK
jgi:hypothetical protein